jgi:hypothetical protein
VSLLLPSESVRPRFVLGFQKRGGRTIGNGEVRVKVEMPGDRSVTNRGATFTTHLAASSNFEHGSNRPTGWMSDRGDGAFTSLTSFKRPCYALGGLASGKPAEEIP